MIECCVVGCSNMANGAIAGKTIAKTVCSKCRDYVLNNMVEYSDVSEFPLVKLSLDEYIMWTVTNE